MSTDPKKDRERYETWLNTPYSKAVRTPVKKESNILKYLAGGALVVGAALAGRKLRGVKKVADAVQDTAKAAPKVAEEGSKLVKAPEVVSKSSTFDDVNKDLQSLDLPKEGKLPEPPSTFDRVNEDLQSLDLPKPAAPRVKTGFEIAGEEMQAAFEKNKQLAKGSTTRFTVPKIPKESKVTKNKGSTPTLKAAAKKVNVNPVQKTSAPTAAQSAPKAEALVSVPKRPKTQAPKAAKPKEVIAETKIPDAKEQEVKQLISQISSTQDLDVREQLIKKAEAVLKGNPLKAEITTPSTPSSTPAIAKRGGSRLERRLAARAELKAKREAAAAPKKSLDDMATDFLKERGVSKTGEVLDEEKEMFREIIANTRGSFTDFVGSDKEIEAAMKAVGGRKSAISDIITQKFLPPSQFDPRETAKAALRHARKSQPK